MVNLVADRDLRHKDKIKSQIRALNILRPKIPAGKVASYRAQYIQYVTCKLEFPTHLVNLLGKVGEY